MTVEEILQTQGWMEIRLNGVYSWHLISIVNLTRFIVTWEILWFWDCFQRGLTKAEMLLYLWAAHPIKWGSSLFTNGKGITSLYVTIHIFLFFDWIQCDVSTCHSHGLLSIMDLKTRKQKNSLLSYAAFDKHFFSQQGN